MVHVQQEEKQIQVQKEMIREREQKQKPILPSLEACLQVTNETY